uniref:RNA-directed DNA polymerase, eukaryota, reverse transcriptase zinc-binding domain protein n=1 Tax=Tanacetum cinerariifolium TaxID=118510 RepID=A0A6L2MNT1_TANCI|nr:RNA-directed DNA polymerase, eukaryota, reverse transcriptase zinc-binding domain protein [Tanacetum cinerariifolium]
MIFKIDFEKTYDSVRWDYLDDILKNFGFGDKWRGWIRNCLMSSKESLFILVQRVVDAGSKVGCLMSLTQSWNEVVNNILARLSKWKMKNLSIGGRLNLLKSVLEHNGKKQIWVKWSKVLASKEKGGLGVSSLYALNRAILFKRVWYFCTQQSSLWTKVIKGIHGVDGKLDTLFWEDAWRGDNNFNSLYPRIYALETQKNVTVASKMSHVDMPSLFCKAPRGGSKESQFIQLLRNMEGLSLVDIKDRWIWSLEGCGEFLVAYVRKVLDDRSLPVVSFKTRWIHVVPIKVNIHAWKVRLDSLPTRLNISKRGMDIESILSPICDKEVESSSHIFFTYHIAREIFRKILC